MRDHHRPKQELITEAIALRKQVVDLREAMADRRRVEDALRHSEEQLRTLLDGCPAGLCLLRSGGGPIAANRWFSRLLGYDSVGELLAMASSFGVFATRDEQDRMIECVCRAEDFSGEVRFRRKDGSDQAAWALGGMPHDRSGIILLVLEEFSAAWHAGTRSASGQRGA
jgi:PAS domain S-box-containing protein